jgi:hypothetical protein
MSGALGTGTSGTYASVTVLGGGSPVTPALMSILNADDIQPGADASYQLCKLIYLYHPLGKRIVEAGIEKAMSKPREIIVQEGAEDVVADEFKRVWAEMQCDHYIYSGSVLSKIYGASALVLVALDKSGKDIDPAEPIDPLKLQEWQVGFNVLDPLNTAGSFVTDQNPNSFTFQKVQAIQVMGKVYHGTRGCVIHNEQPIYIAFTTAAFGYVGRSAYQRVLFPLKSYIATMAANDMLANKVGVLIAKVKQPGSIVDKFMSFSMAAKRAMVKEARTNNVLSVAPDEDIMSLNLQNADGALTVARQNILLDIATGVPMPAILLNQETFAQGFGEGVEDANTVIQYVEGVRSEMTPLYKWMDNIVQLRAWTPEFFASMQARFPDMYGKITYEEAFYEWRNSFSATWPNLREEPEAEKAKIFEVRIASILQVVQLFGAMLDPENMVRLLEWASDCLNDMKIMFTNPLELDFQTAIENLEEMKEMQLAMAEAGAGEGENEGGNSKSGSKPKNRMRLSKPGGSK